MKERATMVEAIQLRKRRATERGTTAIGWLYSRHTFAFGDYFDPQHAGFRSLRVINDDLVEPGGGFGMHGHRDMEILSYVISGELAHTDSLGNGRTIRAGELQYMSAGTGVRHSEFNPSASAPVHFLQIWIEPRERGGPPRYADQDMRARVRENELAMFASPDGRDGSVAIRQDALICFGRLAAGRVIVVPADPGRRYAWIHLISGQLRIGAETLGPGDGAAIEAATFTVSAEQPAEFLLFRLP